MAELTREEVEDIAQLARLALSSAEVARLQADLGSILAYMEALREVDTSGVEPMTHAVPMTLRLRADETAPSLPTEVALADAPAPDADGSFRVPHIIKPGMDT